ncbi:MAG: T9SS type A sorting domain-containing protein [Bacteroidales bacterium]|nr:T9SS type A sorting domain-containing protein [Bacteroidales bacterium]
MTKKLLFGLATLALSANIAMASVAPVKLAKQAGSNRVSMQKTVAGDDTQLLLEDFEEINTTTMMPEGWTIVDAATSINCAQPAVETNGTLQAFSGTFTLVSMYSDEDARNAWAISPAIQLEAGVTYHFGTWAFCMGYGNIIDEWEMTIGNAATAEAQTTTIIDCKGSNAKKDTEWNLYSGTFTPATSGTYYFAIHHCTGEAGGNICMWDYVQVDSDHIRIMPEGTMMSKGGLWSIDQFMVDNQGYRLVPRVYTYEGETFEYGYNATNCESVLWDFGFYGSTDDDTAEKPIVTFELEEDNNQVFNEDMLILINEDGETGILREYYINRIHNTDGYGDCVGNFKPEDNLYTFTSSDNVTYDALCGLSETCNRFAERFDRPANVKTIIAGSYVLFGNYKISPVHASKTITARILKADENNMPGEEVFSKEFKIKDVFGTSEIASGSLSLGAIVFNAEIEVTGTFFFEIEFPEIQPSSNNRLFMAHSYARENGDYTTYFYNNIDLANKPAGWYSSRDFYGIDICSGIYPNVYFNDNSAVKSVAVAEWNVFANGSELNIVNARENADIVITDIAGRVVFTTQAQAIKTTIETNLNNGVYIVTIDGVSTKVVIR